MQTYMMERTCASYHMQIKDIWVPAICSDVVAVTLDCRRSELPDVVEVLVTADKKDVDDIRGNGFRLKPYLPTGGAIRKGLPDYEFSEVNWKDGDELAHGDKPCVQDTDEMPVLVDGSDEDRAVVGLHSAAMDVLQTLVGPLVDGVEPKDIFVLIREV